MIDRPTFGDIKRAYREIDERGLPEFTFGEFVRIHKLVGLPGNSQKLLAGQESNLPAVRDSMLPGQAVSPEIDYAGMLICPRIKDSRIEYLVVTLDGEERWVQHEQIESWLEPVAKVVAFLNRQLQLDYYFNSAIERVQIAQSHKGNWFLRIHYKLGRYTTEQMREVKKQGLPKPSKYLPEP